LVLRMSPPLEHLPETPFPDEVGRPEAVSGLFELAEGEREQAMRVVLRLFSAHRRFGWVQDEKARHSMVTASGLSACEGSYQGELQRHRWADHILWVETFYMPERSGVPSR